MSRTETNPQALFEFLKERPEKGMKTPVCPVADFNWRLFLQAQQQITARDVTVYWKKAADSAVVLGTFPTVAKGNNPNEEPTVLLTRGPFAGFLGLTSACMGGQNWFVRRDELSAAGIVITRPLQVMPADHAKRKADSANWLLNYLLADLRRLKINVDEGQFLANCEAYSRMIGMI